MPNCNFMIVFLYVCGERGLMPWSVNNDSHLCCYSNFFQNIQHPETPKQYCGGIFQDIEAFRPGLCGLALRKADKNGASRGAPQRCTRQSDPVPAAHNELPGLLHPPLRLQQPAQPRLLPPPPHNVRCLRPIADIL